MLSLQHNLLPWIEEKIPAPSIKDSGLNGLQIFSQDHVRSIGFAVSTNGRTLQKGQELGIDTLIVHHGIFWGGAQQALTGIHGERIKKHYQYGVNLIGLHLPLDIHPQWGNNAQLGALLEWDAHKRDPHGLVYRASVHTTVSRLLEKISSVLGRPATAINTEAAEAKAQRGEALEIAWCSGAGGDLFLNYPCDLFLSGEFCEHHYDLAIESNTGLIAAGHYATERLGILALKAAIEKHFAAHSIATHFIEAWSPW